MKSLFIALILVFATAGGAVASDIDSRALKDAKVAGVVGERADGLVGIVGGSATPDVRTLVREVNDERMERYRKVALENNISVQAVQKVAGERLIRSTPAGQYIMGNGGWERK